MKTELLAPAGNLEKLKLALYFGADAVYLGCKQFSLRASAGNFGEEDLAEGIAYAHARGKKVYVCTNIFAQNADMGALSALFPRLEALGADGVLISDLGVLRVARRTCPHLPVHISTQANTMNAEAVALWRELGASRVVLARELSLREIAEIHAAVPEIELEAFVHGAMCISYSGRCYLSDYLHSRSSNRGACAQPCRERYLLTTEGGELLSAEEDGRGTYLLNSRDLNLSEHLEELMAAGVCSFKIEGRMKSESYLATVVGAYRRRLDGAPQEIVASELDTIAHRTYTTAYALGENGQTISPDGSQEAGSCDFVGIVRGYEEGSVCVEMRSRFYTGDVLEILSPALPLGSKVCVGEMTAPDGSPCRDAKLVQGRYRFSCPTALHAGDILRRRRG